MKLIRKNPAEKSADSDSRLSGIGQAVNRRTFLKQSGIAVGAGAAASPADTRQGKKGACGNGCR